MWCSGSGRGLKRGRHGATGGRGAHSQRMTTYQPPPPQQQAPVAHKFQVNHYMLVHTTNHIHAARVVTRRQASFNCRISTDCQFAQHSTGCQFAQHSTGCQVSQRSTGCQVAQHSTAQHSTAQHSTACPKGDPAYIYIQSVVCN